MSEAAGAKESNDKPLTEFEVASQADVSIATNKDERKKRREKRRARHAVRAWLLQETTDQQKV